MIILSVLNIYNHIDSFWIRGQGGCHGQPWRLGYIDFALTITVPGVRAIRS